MQPFYEIRLPDTISYGAKFGPSWKTDVVAVRSGTEIRTSWWANPLYAGDVAYGVKSLVDMNALVSFFHTMRGRLCGFRFKDWSDYRVTAEPITHGAQVSGDKLQLTKRYGTGQNDYIRKITKPVAGTVTLQKNGTAFTSYTLDTTTGLMTLSASLLAGDALTWSGEFDVPVRFSEDRIETSYDAYDMLSTSVPIQEIRI